MLRGKIYSFIGGIANVKTDDQQFIKCKPLGIFRFKDKKVTPIVGDDVCLEQKDGEYQIVQVNERKNQLVRPNVANVDLVLIIQSVLEPNLNVNLLNKFLMFYEYHLDNVAIAFTKTDLLDSKQKKSFKEVKQNFIKSGYQVFDLNLKKEFKAILDLFTNKYVCLVGNSGVGKSTFLNKINPDLLLRVQEISKALNRGKHTTTNVSIIDFGKYHIIDTPGFSSLDLDLSPTQVAIAWKQFRQLAANCKFSNCLHLTEPGCNVKKEVKNNKILDFRYNYYCSLLESLKNK